MFLETSRGSDKVMKAAPPLRLLDYVVSSLDSRVIFGLYRPFKAFLMMYFDSDIHMTMECFNNDEIRYYASTMMRLDTMLLSVLTRRGKEKENNMH